MGGGGSLFFRDFCRFPPPPPTAYVDPLFINFSNFTRKVNKVFKGNPDFVSSLLYFVPVF